MLFSPVTWPHFVIRWLATRTFSFFCFTWLLLARMRSSLRGRSLPKHECLLVQDACSRLLWFSFSCTRRRSLCSKTHSFVFPSFPSFFLLFIHFILSVLSVLHSKKLFAVINIPFLLLDSTFILSFGQVPRTSTQSRSRALRFDKAVYQPLKQSSSSIDCNFRSS